MDVRQLRGGIAFVIAAVLCNFMTAPITGSVSTLGIWFYFVVMLGGAGSAIFGWMILAAISRQPRSCIGTFSYFLGSLLLCGGIIAIGFGRTILVVNRTMNNLQSHDALMWLAGSLVLAAMAFVGCIAYWLNLPKRPRIPDDHLYEDSEIYRTPVVMFTSPTPKLKVGADGELVQVAQSSDEGEIVLQGAGNQVTQVVYLDVGRYQIEYQFNIGQICEIVLVNVDDIESANLLVVRDGGTGSKTFAVQFSGRYAFEVQCPFVSVTWNFRCRLL